MSKKLPHIDDQSEELPAEQMSMIERNLEMSIDERIMQLQSAVTLIEELRRSMKEANEHRLQSPTK